MYLLHSVQHIPASNGVAGTVDRNLGQIYGTGTVRIRFDDPTWKLGFEPAGRNWVRFFTCIRIRIQNSAYIVPPTAMWSETLHVAMRRHSTHDIDRLLFGLIGQVLIHALAYFLSSLRCVALHRVRRGRAPAAPFPPRGPTIL